MREPSTREASGKVAVIPARGGSKRIPRKNVRPFAGRPMLAWSITAARASGVFDRILVSTEDAEIAAVARDWGAEVLPRSAALADDHATVIDVVRDAIATLDAAGQAPTYVAAVYATAPTLTAEDLRRGLAMLEADPGLSYALAVAPYASPIQRALRRDAAGRLDALSPEHRLTRSQDLEPAWHDAGQLCWGRAAAWRANTPIFSSATAGLVLPAWRVQDIDTPEDWERAERIFAATPREEPPPSAWRCLPRPSLSRGEHAVRAVGPDDVEPIRQWRNAQLDVLRQAAPLTPEAQAAYYAREIWPSLSEEKPRNILLTLWWRGERIGYGGLVHVQWPYARAEVSFLLAPALAGTPAECEVHFPAFLALMRELAFEDLGLRRLTTETYATRPAHLAALEAAGFTREGLLREHVRVGDRWVDALIHGLLKGDS